MCIVFLAVVSLFYINEPVIEMREKASAQSEVVSTAYYSEQVNVLDNTPSPEWCKIQTSIDGYEGWVKKDALKQSEVALFKDNAPLAKVMRCSALLYDKADTAFGPILILPFESRLEVLDASNKRWIKVVTIDGKEGFIQRGDIALDSKVCTMQEVLTLTKQFLGLPYIWGGRSSFGYDCSGFVQMLYRQMNVLLPRDSKDQFKYDGLVATSKENIKPGDLIFWGLAEDKIRHVGLYLGNDEFIHSSVRENKPWVRKSLLTDIEWNGLGQAEAGYCYRAFRTLK